MKRVIGLLPLFFIGSLQAAGFDEKLDGSLNDQLRAAISAENYPQAIEILNLCEASPGECDLNMSVKEDDDERTPLHWGMVSANDYGNEGKAVDFVIKLLKMGANPNQTDNLGEEADHVNTVGHWESFDVQEAISIQNAFADARAQIM